MELAFPMTQANKMFKRVRELLDAQAAGGTSIVATYGSGINIKFAKTVCANFLLSDPLS